MAQVDSPEVRYPRGSEWRRWDLHVHTPCSVLNNGFGNDFDAYAKLVFESAVEHEIAVIGVTDYFTIDGYKQLREIQNDRARLTELLGEEQVRAAHEILLLANIELRLSDIIRVDSKDSRVNLHIIFSEDVEPDEIEENFLRNLKFTSQSSPGSQDERRSLTKANLLALGARLKENHPPFRSKEDLEVGMEQAVVSHGEITDILSRDRSFKGRHLVLVDPDEDLSKISWDGQGHNTRSLLMQKADMLFSANPGTHSFGLGMKHDSVDEFEAEFNARKPCVHGCDAHSPEKLFKYDQDRQLWVRANPTFDGLCQLIHEPEDRVYVGHEPPAVQRVREAATKSLARMEFRRTGKEDSRQRWFSGELPLNPGLVAVIGKKGSGKSALADITGLVGEARTREDFSFLTKKRFLNPKQNLGERFEATLEWRSAERRTRHLDYEGDETLPERVKHIPQNYLEKICVDIEASSGRTLFDKELEAVIFSHVPKPDRLGRASLRELFEHTIEEKEARIKQRQDRLATLNREYVALRRQSTAEAKKAVQAQLQQRENELEAHRKAKPQEVGDPSKVETTTPEAQKAEEELSKVVAKIEELDVGTSGLLKKQEEAKRRKVAAQRLATRIENLEVELAAFREQSSEEAELLGLKVDELISVQSDPQRLVALEADIDKQLAELARALDAEQKDSITHERTEASKRADELRRKLGEPQRRYQEYQRALANWRKRGTEIIGSEEESRSVKGIEARLEALERAPERARDKRAEREALMREIFAAKSELLDSYRELYSPVQAFIEEHDVAQEVDALAFSAAIAIDGLEDSLLAMIHQGRRGSFQGEQEGRERLRALIERNDFSSADGVAAFLEELGSNLESDLRGDKAQAIRLEDQLVQGASAEGLYDFLFGLDYLQPRFELLWRRKPLNQLSPGERRTLLLIFYLLIDREDVPLIIDQPEENLDNETVAELLVPAVKYAKKRRQIIMVTHNPNLAVVCDADQVIHASIDKANGNRVTYTSGAIEDPAITQLIVNVLEGTKPAFDLRDAKYEVLDRA